MLWLGSDDIPGRPVIAQKRPPRGMWGQPPWGVWGGGVRAQPLADFTASGWLQSRCTRGQVAATSVWSAGKAVAGCVSADLCARCFLGPRPRCGIFQGRRCARSWLWPCSYILHCHGAGEGAYAFCKTGILYFITRKRPTLQGQIKSFLSLFNGIWMNRVKYALCIHW